ncbi:MAG: substrate-binding domain-containing protein [Rhizobiales bacterium]|nr:substrate-binding domain-containing protein [Hyphomicrobiales bacterium]
MGGTGSGLELLRTLGNAYTLEHPEVTVEIVPSLGTSGGLSALADRIIDLAVSARPLKPEEAEKGLKEVTSARTPFLLVTSRDDPDRFRAADVAPIFGEPEPTWANGDPLRVVLRPESEADSRLLQEFFPGMPEAIQKARSRPEIPVAATDQDNAKIAERSRALSPALHSCRSRQRTSRFDPSRSTALNPPWRTWSPAVIPTARFCISSSRTNPARQQMDLQSSCPRKKPPRSCASPVFYRRGNRPLDDDPHQVGHQDHGTDDCGRRRHRRAARLWPGRVQ